jgi:uncharacterized protein DUF6484
MSRSTNVLALKLAATSAAQPHRVGTVVGTRDGHWLVDYPGNPHGPLLARSVVHVDAVAMDRIAAANAEVLLVFENDRLDLPIVVGLLTPDPLVTPVRGERGATDTGRLEAIVDGQRVVVEAKDEIVLRCGEASVTLRRNGRVVVRGTYVETRSKGVNRIKGGSVQIN